MPDPQPAARAAPWSPGLPRDFSASGFSCNLSATAAARRRAFSRNSAVPAAGSRLGRLEEQARRPTAPRAAQAPPRKSPGPADPASRDARPHISGTISSATMLMILISGFTAGPAVSLYGSPTVSPVTAALCASRALAAVVAVFDVLLGVVPGAAAGAHRDGDEQAGDDGAHQHAAQRLRAEHQADHDRHQPPAAATGSSFP